METNEAKHPENQFIKEDQQFANKLENNEVKKLAVESKISKGKSRFRQNLPIIKLLFTGLTTVGAIWAVYISNQSLAETRKAIASSDATSERSLEISKDMAKSNKEMSDSYKENTMLNRKLVNAFENTLDLNKKSVTAQLNEYKRNLNRYLSENEPHLKIDNLRIPLLIGDKLVIELKIRSFGKQPLKIDFSTFHIKPTKKVENPIVPEYILAKPETLSQWNNVQMFPYYITYETPKVYSFKVELNDQQLRDFYDNNLEIVFFGEVYYMNLIRNVNVAYSFCWEIKNFTEIVNEYYFESDVAWDEDLLDKIAPGFEPDSLLMNSYK
ncbi:MAG: hypothetical protein WBO44_14360 [Saprospiraceae bacterium]